MIHSFELVDLIKIFGDDSVSKMLSSFSVDRNQDVQSFIRYNCLKYEKSHNARSYILMNDDMKVLAFFSLSMTSMPIPVNASNTMKRRMRGFGKFSAENVTVFLIGQLARDDNATSEEISLPYILEIIKNRVQVARNIIGGRCIAVDCLDKLVPLYESNGFTKINKTDDLKPNDNVFITLKFHITLNNFLHFFKIR